MSLSFDQWRKAERQKAVDLRAFKRTAPRRMYWPRFRAPRQTSLLIAGLIGVAIVAAVVPVPWEPSPVMLAPATAIVVDGDTLKIGSERVRLHGIDAPEYKQRCADGWQAGEAARHALASLVWAGKTQCEKVTTDRYGRTVAICRVNGEDIGAAMVRRGMAWAYTPYSFRYLPEEMFARFDGVGVHSRSCTLPSAWRAQHRR
jgi:endonuclease YncB( thermonuclease family)